MRELVVQVLLVCEDGATQIEAIATRTVGGILDNHAPAMVLSELNSRWAAVGL